MKKVLAMFAVLVLTLPAVWWFLGSGYYNMHDDLQVMRIVEMEKCLSDGQIPCRWAPDMAWGYGQAMFNFYSVLPYYLGALIRIITPLTIIGTVKALFVVAYVASAVGMYLLSKEFFGKVGGIVASVLYTYAPYHALDIYVRGAMAESFSLAILPFLWFFIYKLIKTSKLSTVTGVSISIAALLTSHNISTMIYVVPTAVWTIYWLVALKSYRVITKLVLSVVLGAGLAAFFIIPAVFEQSLIQVEHLTRDYSDYHAHFVSINQLFLDRSWGDGPSIFGDQDEISFQIGWPHWWLTIPALIICLYFFLKRKNRRVVIITAIILAFGYLSAFLTHPRSLFLWEKIPILSFVQFPWRFLGLTIFFMSLASAIVVTVYSRLKFLLAFVIIFITIFLNRDYTWPVHFSRLVKDEEKLIGVAWDLQRKAAILDYLPKTAKMAPQSGSFDEPKFISGDGVVKNFSKGSDRFSFDADIYNESEIEISVMYFPGWVLIVDGKEVELKTHGDYGLIKVKLDAGNHMVEGRFTDTKIRSIANFATLISGSALLIVSIISRKKDEKD